MESPMLHYVRCVMILSGTLPVHLVSSHKGFYTIYQYVVQTSLVIFLLLMYTPILTSKFEGTEMNVKIISDIILFTIVYTKGRVCVSKNMSELITDLICHEAKLMKTSNSTIRSIYTKIVKKSKLIQIVNITLIVPCAIAFIVPHYVNHFLSKNEYKSNLYTWWLPVDDKKHHLSILLLQTYCAMLACVYYLYISTILIILPLYIILRLRTLKSNIIDIDSDRGIKLNTVRNKVKMCIEEHIDIIRNCVFLNVTVRYIMLLEFLVASFQLALALFQIISAEKLINAMYSLGFLAFTLVQLLMLYWHANQITEEGLDVANVVYALPWYQYDKSIKTSLLLMMMRSQRALNLTVGPFGNMTMEMYVKILKGVYTYMTLMQQQTFETD